ncbi:MAG: tRNA (N(6)-L-threonylcarbamoyladenosine(37)-C(2))-methylthiotransferase MtaB [Bacteroidetes bacterium]|nr:MAG: tRNA (N(6)-L-threonylcarbamoyladenosine(37)-C(2))-methylthiotransferase MtaB [Bacteroidota bacterium]
MSSVSIHTLGCKLNYAESGALSDEFRRRQFDIVPYGQASDVTVINTCSVTEEADRKCRQAIRRAMRLNPDTYIVVTGCYAQLQPDNIAAIPGVDSVLGSAEKFRLFDLISDFEKREQTQIHVSCIDEATEFGPAFASGDRTRAFLKIQDGCDYSCSFCTIPMARGRSRSAKITQIVAQALEIVDRGFREIVLSGVNIGLFGEDTGESLIELLRALDSVTGIERFRISSIEPNLLTDEIIDFVAESRAFVPHFHMPLQSGDDEILGKMRRRYKRERYADRIAKIRSVMPDACIGVDIIVGFPDETDAHFMRTFTFLEELPVSYLHVFTYSERPNTVAVDLVESGAATPIQKVIRGNRNAALRRLSESKRTHFYESQLGTQRTVLWEDRQNRSQTGMMTGFTENYVKVEREIDPSLVNQTELIRLVEMTSSSTVRAEPASFVSLI